MTIPQVVSIDYQPLIDAIAALPAFPADGVCTYCGVSAWQVIEEGYSRYSSADMTDGVLVAFSDGWDDMSEGGRAEWVECDTYRCTEATGCGAAFQCPDEMEWS